MRELRVAELNQSIDAVFADIQLLAMQCRFADCRHETELGCAVLRAIQEAVIDARRLANYRKLIRENALATATLAEKRSQGRDFAKMVKEGKRIKQRKVEP